MPKFKLALDRSARHIDADGRLHVASSHISKAAINPYYGQEIPGFEALGLIPDKIYRLLRDPVELERGAETFARLPILSVHKPLTVDIVADDPELKKLVIGAIGSDVKFNAPYLDADLCFWDQEAIAGIETESIIELSCGYRYVPVMTPGEYEGEQYDGIMTEIRGNHLALVEVGRAGSDVVVADHNPFKHKDKTDMKKTKLGRALLVALCAASPVLAADSALPELVGAANRKSFDRKGVKSKILGMDSELDPETLDGLIDALLDVEDSPKAEELPQGAADESPVEKIRALLVEAGVSEDTINSVCALVPEMTAADEEPDDGIKKEEMEAALDSMSKNLRKQFMEADEARRDVRLIVGDVLGMDSAVDVYGFALDHMKVDRQGVQGVPALRALFKVAAGAATVAPVTIAQDSAGLATLFPNAARFGK